jgi:ribosomal protein S18 acetylase RimI-like enzyme
MSDMEALLRLEALSFDSDRLSPRSLRRLLASPSAAYRVAGSASGLAGTAILLFRSGSRVARLYSIAVDPGQRGKGLAETLLTDAETTAQKRGRDVLRLEVRVDNLPAIRLYQRLGYRPIGRNPGYYGDGVDAFRYEKRLGAREGRATDQPDEDRSSRDSGTEAAYIGLIPRRDVAAARQDFRSDAPAETAAPLAP